MSKWVEALAGLLDGGDEVVMVTQIAVRGSAPREPGARILVTRDSQAMTLGGGHLEYRAIEIARDILQNDANTCRQRFSLGAGLGQCCGGAVELLFERFKTKPEWLSELQQQIKKGGNAVLVLPSDDLDRSLYSVDKLPPSDPLRRLVQTALQNNLGCSMQQMKDEQGEAKPVLLDPVQSDHLELYLFGAGHVGQALVSIMQRQNCRIHWIDCRDGLFPERIDAVVEMICTDTPEAEILTAPVNAYFMIMTHDHSLDLRLTAEVLKRDDFAYLGLIGSRSKRQSFEHRLRDRGYSAAQLERITCPIGIGGINSKQPAAIALSSAAQLIQLHEARQQISGLEMIHRNRA